MPLRGRGSRRRARLVDAHAPEEQQHVPRARHLRPRSALPQPKPERNAQQSNANDADDDVSRAGIARRAAEWRRRETRAPKYLTAWR
eukprot:176445-Rhodomonas_salina.1